jgi:hypothetical protein
LTLTIAPPKFTLFRRGSALACRGCHFGSFSRWEGRESGTSVGLVVVYGKFTGGIPAAVVVEYMNGYTKGLEFFSTEPHIT